MNARFVISVPIGSWNPALPSVVRSILAQARSPALAVMDASGDPRVAEALLPLEPLIAYRRTGPDAGQAAAIQEGWDNVKGELYGWLNADDFLYPGALSRVAEAFDANPEVNVVTGQSLFVDPAHGILGLHPGLAPVSDQLARSNTISQPSTFVRVSALKSVGGLDTSLAYIMDWDLWWRLHQQGSRFLSLPDTLSGVVMEPGTKTAQFNARRRREIQNFVARSAGRAAALKSLIGFWIYNRAGPDGSDGLFGRLFRARRDKVPGAPAGELLAGVGLSGPASIAIAHFNDTPARAIRLEADGAVIVGMARTHIAPSETFPVDIPPGETVEISMSPAAGTVQIKALRLLF